MKKSLKRVLSTVLASAMLFSSMTVVNMNPVFAADAITASSVGWHETAYTEWLPVSGAASYEAYVKKTSESNYTKLDDELVREYDTFVRADALGLAAGTYNMKIVAKNSSGAEIASYESGPITVDNYIRDGFAFSDGGSSSGAYNDDGTLKSNAKVFYVTEENKDSITMDVVTNSKGTTTTCVGLGPIVVALQKGYETTPLDFRFIGQVTAPSDRDQSLNQLDIKRAATPITIEGVGNDAFALFGFNLVEANNVEVRNLGFKDMTTKDEDGVTIKGNSQRVWVHNCDFFYGGQGSDKDQAKGDGTVDLKETSTKITVSDNHYWDSGKVNLCGLGEDEDYEITYSRNWFDHSDSRHPRVRTGSIHVYNNYYDGVSKYGVGACTGSSIFVEGNYFRNTSKPVMSSKQGTDAQGSGTFSGEAGGIIKMYDNIMVGTYTFIEANLGNGSYNLDSDGYTVSSRNETVPSEVKTVSGGTSYNNFDTTRDLGVDASGVLAAKDVPAYVTANAGRIDGGNFQYIFDDATEDSNYDVITEMTNALAAYKYKADTAYVSSKSATGIDGNTFYTERTDAYESKNATLPVETDPEGNKATGGGSGGNPSSTVDLSLNADDVDTGTYSNTTVSGLGTNGAFSIIANTSDAVTVSSSKGIQLGGAGDVSTGKRLISVTLEKPGTIYVRCSSTGTDERTINVSDTSGDIKGTIQTGASNGVHVDTAGTYYIYSSNKGINVSLITVSYDGSEGSSQTTTKSEVATETTTKATETTTSAASGGDDETETTTSTPVTPPSGDNIINSSMTLSRGSNDSYVTVYEDENSSGAWKVGKATSSKTEGYLLIKLGKTADLTITGGGEKDICISQTLASTDPEYKAEAAKEISFINIPAGTWYIYNTEGKMTINEIVVTMDSSAVDPDSTTTSETTTESTTASATTTTEAATEKPTEGTTEATDYKTITEDITYSKANFAGNEYFAASDSTNVYAHDNGSIRLKAAGSITFTVADGATVKIMASGANATDSTRTLTLSNDSGYSKAVTLNNKADGVTESTYGEKLAAGTYTLKSSNDVDITYVAVTFTTEPVDPGFVKGDANGDGVVTSADVKEILNYVVGLIESVANPEAADVNNDSKVSSSDAYIIQKYINKGIWQ